MEAEVQAKAKAGSVSNEAGRWVELRDAQGKLQAKYDPVTRVLEIQRRGVKTRYELGRLSVRNGGAN